MLKKYSIIILEKLLGSGTVYAHCDIPCGIYTTEPALTAARTVKVMVQKIQEAEKSDIHNISRLVSMKEKHSQICKDELLILWSDFFKQEHLDKLPELHNTIWDAVKLCSANKRTSDMGEADNLVSAVENVDKMFKSVQS